MWQSLLRSGLMAGVTGSVLLNGAASAIAETFMVKDCKGEVRLVQDLTDQLFADIEVTVTSDGAPAVAGTVTLSSPDAKQPKREGTIQTGSAIITRVPSGEWQACPDGQGLEIVRVAVVEQTGNSQAAAVGAGALAFGGGIAAIVANNGSSGSGEDSLPEVRSPSGVTQDSPIIIKPSENSTGSSGSSGTGPSRKPLDSECVVELRGLTTVRAATACGVATPVSVVNGN